MPKFSCRCGHVINLSGDTAQAACSLVLEKNIEAIGARLWRGESVSDAQFFDAIDAGRKIVYRCPACHRLHVEKDGMNLFDTYTLEPG